MRCWTFLALIGCLSCQPVSASEAPPTDELFVEETPRLEEELADALPVPSHMLVFGQDYPTRPAPDPTTVASGLRPNGEAGPLLAALLAGGMSEEDAIAWVHAAAGHNSGQPYDPVRVRADEWRATYREAVETFREELAAVESESSEATDDATLRAHGIVLGWQDLP